MNGHSHTDPAICRHVPRRIAVGLGVAVGVGLATALVGMIVLWPPHQHLPVPAGFTDTTPTVTGTVVVTRLYDCQ